MLPCCLAVLCFRVQTSCSAPSAVTALQEMLFVNWNNAGDRFALPFIASSVKKNSKPKYFGWCQNICKSNYIPISFRRLGLEVGFHLVTSWKLWSCTARSCPFYKTLSKLSFESLHGCHSEVKTEVGTSGKMSQKPPLKNRVQLTSFWCVPSVLQLNLLAETLNEDAEPSTYCCLSSARLSKNALRAGSHILALVVDIQTPRK